MGYLYFVSANAGKCEPSTRLGLLLNSGCEKSVALYNRCYYYLLMLQFNQILSNIKRNHLKDRRATMISAQTGWLDRSGATLSLKTNLK